MRGTAEAFGVSHRDDEHCDDYAYLGGRYDKDREQPDRVCDWECCRRCPHACAHDGCRRVTLPPLAPVGVRTGALPDLLASGPSMAARHSAARHAFSTAMPPKSVH